MDVCGWACACPHPSLRCSFPSLGPATGPCCHKTQAHLGVRWATHTTHYCTRSTRAPPHTGVHDAAGVGGDTHAAALQATLAAAEELAVSDSAEGGAELDAQGQIGPRGGEGRGAGTGAWSGTASPHTRLSLSLHRAGSALPLGMRQWEQKEEGECAGLPAREVSVCAPIRLIILPPPGVNAGVLGLLQHTTDTSVFEGGKQDFITAVLWAYWNAPPVPGGLLTAADVVKAFRATR